MTIEELRKSGWIAYEYIRGSHAYGLNTETSDEDHGGVFICPPEMLMGLRSKYIEQVADEKNNTVFYEFGRWIELLLKSNPTALESLYIPQKCVIGKIHPAVQEIINNRDKFLSKVCFSTLCGYAVSQIGKARGLNKKIVNPVTERKDVLDFCYTFKGQGSQPIKEFLSKHNLDQRYCGLINIPNMKDVYGVYYDVAAYLNFEDIDFPTRRSILFDKAVTSDYDYDRIIKRMNDKVFFGYVGITNPNDYSKSNSVRLSSIPKGETPICFMSWNKDAYVYHCKQYKEYKDWEKHRNPVRYENNLGHNYDSKNMCHCMRLTRMGKELALGQGFNLERTYDREYLLDIKNHKFSYEEIMAQAEKEKAEMDKAIETCTLPDTINVDEINNILINARKKIYGTDNC